MKKCGHPLVTNVVSDMPAAVYGECKLCGELVTARWNTSKGWLAEDRLREKEPLFKADHFAKCACHPELNRINAEYANLKVKHLLGSVVYGNNDNPDREFIWSENRKDHDTHTARLFNVRKVKEECQHKGSERISLTNGQLTNTGYFRCMKCGVKLTPTWGVE